MCKIVENGTFAAVRVSYFQVIVSSVSLLGFLAQW